MSCTHRNPASLAIFIGTMIQQQISCKIIPELKKSVYIKKIDIISLDNYYKFGINFDKLQNVIILNAFFRIPWYDRNKLLKIISLFQFFFQILFMSRRYTHYLFYVDTGLIERTAITILRLLGRRTIVLQDALKRRPRKKGKNALSWFGGGGADLYLLTGDRFKPMVRKGITAVVGSPVYNNIINPQPLEGKILIVNQCFARYGETSEEEEIQFIKQVVLTAVKYGEVELRLHPHNSLSHYEFLRSDMIDVSTDKPMQQSLKKAGIVLAINSTVILEALAMGRPVVTLDWHPSPYEQPIREGIISCKNLQGLNDILNVWILKKEVQTFALNTIQKELKSFVAFTGQNSIELIIKHLNHFISLTT